MSSRADMLKSLGTLPEVVEPMPEILDSRDRENHVLHLVRYTVETGENVTAYLLMPKDGKANYPAIIASHQHNHEYDLGKSEPAGLAGDPMYHYGLDLCLRGYAVLCPDHLGFESRRLAEPWRVENANLDGEKYERLLFCRYLLDGSTLQAKYLSDLSRAVDVLQSFSFVDAGRIGAIGHSLGGQESLWLMWYDQRIKAAVSSCGFSRIRDIMDAGINHNFAMFCPGFLRTGDVEDLVCALAPRPFMMTSGTKDPIYPLKGTRKIAEAAGEAYSAAGMPENFKALFFDGSHAFPPDIREQAYAWLDKYLG